MFGLYFFLISEKIHTFIHKVSSSQDVMINRDNERNKGDSFKIERAPN